MLDSSIDQQSTNRIFGTAQQESIESTVSSFGLVPFVIDSDLDGRLIEIDTILDGASRDSGRRYRRAINDITFGKSLNERLAISQRLLALGELRGTIPH